MTRNNDHGGKDERLMERNSIFVLFGWVKKDE